MDAGSPASRWRLLLTPPLGGAENMAVELALMQRARATGETVVRLYSWTTPTLSFGRNQTALGCYDRQRLSAAGIAVVRRPTGGRTILHDHEVTYSVTAPVAPETSLKSAYQSISALILEALARVGVPTALAQPVARAPRPSAAPCFDTPSAGELIADGRKLVGSAQWRENGVLLQHGSILVEDDQTRITEFMTTPSKLPAPATLRDLLGRSPSADEVAQVLFDVVREGVDSDASKLESMSVLQAGRAYVPIFTDNAWTWRR